MRKLTKLLALALAVVMLLPTTALAADNSASDGPKLMMNWLDWDENGLCYVRDECLSGEDRGTDVLGTAPGDEPCVIFFTVGADGKRTPVIPKAGKGVTIETVEKESIAPNAKQSKYYVRVCLDDWGESEVTSGKATMKVVAQLPDVGFYTTAEATEASYLRNDQQPIDPSQLTDNTVYFVRKVFDDPNQRQIKELKKGSNGNPNMYDLEKVNDNVWKITLKIPEDGGAGVDLDITWQEPDGNTYNDERGCGFEYPRGPELQLQWLSWDDDPQPGGEPFGGDFQVVPDRVEEYHVAFYAWESESEKPIPVPVDQLKADKGVTITPLLPGDKERSHYAIVSVDDWGDYTISYNEYSITLKSQLRELDLYSKPEISTDNFLGKLRYNPLNPNGATYVGACLPEGDERTLENMELADFENRSQYTLERYSDDFYKLTLKSVDIPDGDVMFNVTWKWPDGHTETQTWGVWSERWPALLAGESAPEIIDRDHPVKYSDWKDKVSDKLTLAAGESKDLKICFTFFPDTSDTWTMGRTSAWGLRANDSNLKITTDDTDYAKMTLSCDVPGTYTISMHGIYPDIKAIYHADGTKYTAEELRAFDENNGYELTRDQKQVRVYNEEHETGALFEEAFPGEKIEFEVVDEEIPWYPITVTVTGGTGTTTPSTAFTDVKTSDWFAPAVSYANGKGYMNGNEGKFDPNGKITGAQFAQILYNKEGKPAAAEGAAFQGVTDQWYAPAILWAAGKGIVADTGDAAVVPTADLTREQIALMLYNYMGKPEAKGDLTAFTDAAKVSAWAKDAMAWAVGEGVLKGSDNALNPTGTATRAETAQILMNFFK